MKFPFGRANAFASVFIWSALSAAPGQVPTDAKPDSLMRNLPKRPDSTQVDSTLLQHCVIRIPTLLVEDMKLDDTLDLIVEANGIEIGGCLLKLAVASDVIDIVDILPGELVDSCRWEMFDARQIPSDVQTGPREVWQITVMAQGFSPKKKPICYGFDRPAVLARLVLSSAHRSSVSDTTAEMFFYWEYCRDNALSDRKGTSLISDSVSDVLPALYTTEQGAFPTRHGSPASCVSPRARNAPRRQVEFHNGGVVFKFELETPVVDSSSTEMN
jgi:hypothetical protein